MSANALGNDPDMAPHIADRRILFLKDGRNALQLWSRQFHVPLLTPPKRRVGGGARHRHTGARRGVPLLGRFLRPGHWLSLIGAPVRWQGGRKARMKETLAQPTSFRVDAVGRKKEPRVSVTPHLCSVPNA